MFVGGYMKNLIQELKIDRLPMSLNEYINIERGNKFAAAKIKKNETESVYWFIKAQELKPMKGKVRIVFHWYVKNIKKDPDNIAFGKKYILDGLVMAGILKNDGQKNIGGFSDHFHIDKKEGVVIYIEYV